MFDALARLFADPRPKTAAPEPDVAVAALLVHLAAIDGTTDEVERVAVTRTLKEHFELDENQVKSLVDEATHRARESVDLYQFTSVIMALPEDERVEIIRMMWQVVFADGKNHELEDNMVWRVAELIGVSARKRTILRNQMKRSLA
jgi:uncharacterized tellurite resistance protein B-like protein